MLNEIFKHKYVLLLLQIISLFIFVLLIVGAFSVYTDDPEFAKTLRNTNLSNLIVWSYWWPLIIITAILFGRYWCSICPMELVTSIFSIFGLRKKPNKFLKSGWVITVLYLSIIIIGIHTFTIHRIPQYMAIYMLILFVMAIVVGLIWEKRTFCTYVCPIGHLLGLYSLLSFKKLRVKDNSVCASCDTKDCISKSHHYKLVARSCTSELYPAKLKNNKDCILCGQCFKSCTKDNISIQKRSLAADLFTNLKLSWAEISFLIILSGFVAYEVLSEWAISEHVLLFIPNQIIQLLDITGHATGTVKALVLFVVFPLIFTSIFVVLKKLFANENIKQAFTQIMIALLPIIASMHLLKSVLKPISRIPYWKYVFSDYMGIDTAKLIVNNQSLVSDNVLLLSIDPVLSVVAIILSISGFVISLFVIKKQSYSNVISKLISNLISIIYFTMFFIIIVAWRFF